MKIVNQSRHEPHQDRKSPNAGNVEWSTILASALHTAEFGAFGKTEQKGEKLKM